MPYRFFDHTADLGIELTAPSREALFAEAVAALAAALTDPKAVAPREARSLTLAESDDGALLVALLNELLYWFDTGWLGRSAEVALRGEPPRVELDAIVRGEPYDPVRHPIKVLLKAATYHALEVAATAGGFRARIVIDL